MTKDEEINLYKFSEEKEERVRYAGQLLLKETLN